MWSGGFFFLDTTKCLFHVDLFIAIFLISEPLSAFSLDWRWDENFDDMSLLTPLVEEMILYKHLLFHVCTSAVGRVDANRKFSFSIHSRYWYFIVINRTNESLLLQSRLVTRLSQACSRLANPEKQKRQKKWRLAAFDIDVLYVIVYWRFICYSF